jgi:deoxyribonuclease V
MTRLPATLGFVAQWPQTPDELVEVQHRLAVEAPPLWHPPTGELLVGGCFVTFGPEHEGAGQRGDPAWSAAVSMCGSQVVAHHVIAGGAGWRYEPGLLALRIGALIESAVRGLPERPVVLLVDATGRDHPRRAGLALHLGAVLDLPTVGVTHRPMLAHGFWPIDERGATSPLALEDGELVGFWLRTTQGVRPIAVHAGWRVDASTAVDLVRRAGSQHRTPEPLRQARRLARTARTLDRAIRSPLR